MIIGVSDILCIYHKNTQGILVTSNYTDKLSLYKWRDNVECIERLVPGFW